jgi:hypothetical protein
MLYRITADCDPYVDLIKDDPVRPEIPTAARLHDQADIFVWLDNGKPGAVTCVTYTGAVPKAVSDLNDRSGTDHAVFYTIWSYSKGSGRNLIQAAQQWLQKERPNIRVFVTLSPKTDMARKFHHGNGARTLQENLETVNYEYNIASTIHVVHS